MQQASSSAAPEKVPLLPASTAASSAGAAAAGVAAANASSSGPSQQQQQSPSKQRAYQPPQVSWKLSSGQRVILSCSALCMCLTELQCLYIRQSWSIHFATLVTSLAG